MELSQHPFNKFDVILIRLVLAYPGIGAWFLCLLEILGLQAWNLTFIKYHGKFFSIQRVVKVQE